MWLFLKRYYIHMFVLDMAHIVCLSHLVHFFAFDLIIAKNFMTLLGRLFL